MFIFADDVTLSIPIHDNDTNNVRNEIQNIKNFCDSSALLLNLAKCFYIYVSNKKNTRPIDISGVVEKSVIKILGVYFSNNLKWDFHIKHITKTANQRFFAIRTLKPFLSNSDLQLMYYSLIQSVIRVLLSTFCYAKC